MAIEVNSEMAQCYKCGTAYGRRKGYFPVSYAVQHKGAGFIPICRECVDNMYNTYLSQCNDTKLAVRQMCRKLDLYWNENIYEAVSKKTTTRTIMTQYIAKINSVTFAGKSYDDTLSSEGNLWNFNLNNEQENFVQKDTINKDVQNKEDIEIADDIVAFWGSGYSPSMYTELEQRRAYYMSKLQNNGEDIDIGSESLIRQICNLEVTIAKDSASGRSIDKSVNALNSLLGSLNIKPTQRKNEDVENELASTPMGVWLYKYENKRPLPKTNDDDNYIKKYIFTWMGHLCKMLGIKNGYTKLYEEEIDRLRVDKPEYEDEDDETILIDSYSEGAPNG